MADKKNVKTAEGGDAIVAKALNFWDKYNKPIIIASVAIIVLISGWYIYKNYVVKPKERKAVAAMFKAEDYYRRDSVNLALNGDGQHWGFLKVIDKYGGTKAGNLARFYAGDCYIKLNENEKAIKYLKKFSTDAKQIQARAYKLIGDAYGDLGKNKDAFDYYKKAGHYFEDDATNSAEALFMAAYLAQRSLNDNKSAIELYKEIKTKFPRTSQARDADNYLAQMGVYNTEE
ncbi:MAG: tetratricopeptide repeat protein [Chitinophagaceae bacterium]|nr:tetratricopeptide repeat protein [Chitinophagaceae bacterium]MCB0740388.1 tetratricopeptide repeat protein [Chitinophagaceae bacterium]HQV06449.1 tetratricopeptide repeat protein [Chitinophagaceae bacterium]